MFRKFLGLILKTSTVKQSSVTLISVFLNGVTGFAFYFLIARFIGAEANGVFGLVGSLVALVSSVANLGVDTAATRFYAKYKDIDRPKAMSALKIAFVTKMTSWSIIAILGILLSGYVAEYAFSDIGLVVYVRIAFAAALGSMAFSFACAVLQAQQRFLHWGAINVGGNIVRLIVTLLFVYFSLLTKEVSILILVVFPFLTALAGFYFLPNFYKVKIKKSFFKNFLKFSLWVGASGVLSAIVSRVDVLIAARYVSLYELGNYSVATTLVAFISQIVMALGMVVAPKFSGFTTNQEATTYLKKTMIAVVALSFVGVAFGVFLAYYFVPFAYGSEYALVSGPLSVLISAYSIFLISMPIHSIVVYYFGNTRIMFVTTLLQGLCLLISLDLLTRYYGILGTSAAVFIGMLVVLFVPLIWLLLKLRNEKQH